MVHFLSIFVLHVYLFNMYNCTTAHPWCDGHSISKSTCGVCGARAEIQVSRRELHTHIHLNQDEVKILSWIKKKKTRIVNGLVSWIIIFLFCIYLWFFQFTINLSWIFFSILYIFMLLFLLHMLYILLFFETYCHISMVWILFLDSTQAHGGNKDPGPCTCCLVDQAWFTTSILD